MTEVPEHLRKRAEAARLSAESSVAARTGRTFPQINSTRLPTEGETWENEMSLRVAEVIVKMSKVIKANQIDNFIQSDESMCIAAAIKLVDAKEDQRKNALRKAIVEFEEEYGEVTEEELKELFNA